MRRTAWTFALALALLVVLAPAAEAQGAGKKGGLVRLPLLSPTPPPQPYEEPPREAPPDAPRAGDAHRSAAPPTTSLDPAPRGVAPEMRAASIFDEMASAAALSVGALLVLGLALLVARFARRPKAKKAPRRSFEAGRAEGRLREVASVDEALGVLRESQAVRVESAERVGAAVRVTVRRRRGEPCDHTSGFLVGLFERAWADDVRLDHPVCGGKKKDAQCVYDVARAPALSPGGGPTGAAWIPGSGGAPRRSGTARRGAG